jgi:alkylation response protein AidB-like acyl-CoA dehydrogenase
LKNLVGGLIPEVPDLITHYRPPIDDIMLALQVAGLDDLLTSDIFIRNDRQSILMVLEGFGRLASEVISPSDRIGDIEGTRLSSLTGEVSTPPVFQRAYEKFIQGGWGSLSFPEEIGGGGLPSVVGIAIQEMFASANMSLSLNSVLTQVAAEALMEWGSTDQRVAYLPRLLTGEWTGAMVITEPDAGSDVGSIRTTAKLDYNGEWKLTGTKVFITWGDHDLTQNILHFVLARTPEATAGTKGLSLFLVPKFLANEVGELGQRNQFKCTRIEEKLGLHGSPTCVMEYDDALCELIGPIHGGMRAMFSMMNVARLSIGIQGPAVAERAFQQAREYASSRLQGRSSASASPASSPIIEHLDVRRMLLTMNSTTQASRLLVYYTRALQDKMNVASNVELREQSKELMDLLTPIAKAWSTDKGFISVSLGVQILGGVGYLEEYGMSQRLRDARIASIYEGTNGIQALDLVSRKISRGGGQWVRHICNEMSTQIPEPQLQDDPLAPTYGVLQGSIQALESATEWLLGQLETQPQDAIAGATSYLELFGLTLGGWLMAKRAQRAMTMELHDVDRIIAESNFFAVEVMGRFAGLEGPIKIGSSTLHGLVGAEDSRRNQNETT